MSKKSRRKYKALEEARAKDTLDTNEEKDLPVGTNPPGNKVHTTGKASSNEERQPNHIQE